MVRPPVRRVGAGARQQRAPAVASSSARLGLRPAVTTSPYPTLALPSPSGNDHAYAGQPRSAKRDDLLAGAVGLDRCVAADREGDRAVARSGDAGQPRGPRPSAPSAPTTTRGRLTVDERRGRPARRGRAPGAGAVSRRARGPRPPGARRTRLAARRTPVGRISRRHRRARSRSPAAAGAPAGRSGAASTPSPASTSSACGAMPSPQALSRGKSARSSSSTPGRPGSRPRSTRRPRACRRSSLESLAPGGQAGTSSKIENYLGFPTGISGQALAGRAQVAGAEVRRAARASRAPSSALDCDARALPARARRRRSRSAPAPIVVATGARYRKLDVAGLRALRGPGHLLRGDGDGGAALRAARRSSSSAAATRRDRPRCSSSRTARHVHMLVRGAGLAATMSHYLVQRIEASPTITLHPHTEITALDGDDVPAPSVTWTRPATAARARRGRSATSSS